MSEHPSESHEVQLIDDSKLTSEANDGLVKPIAIDPPTPGSAVQVADGIWWTRFTLDGTQDHVNAYLLENDDHWTLVDTETIAQKGLRPSRRCNRAN